MNKITQINKVNARDVFEDDNNGFVYGVEWEIDNGFLYDIMWFRTERAREKFIKEMKGGLK